MTSREACARCRLAATPQVSVVALKDLALFLRTLRDKDQTIGPDATAVKEEETRPDETIRDAKR